MAQMRCASDPAADPCSQSGSDGGGGEVIERRRSEGLLAAQNRALEVVAGPAPLAEALEALSRIVEEQADHQAVAAILLLGEDGCLRTGAAPSLPAEYCAAIDGIEAAAGVGTCCDAAARNDVVCTPDIASASSWNGLSHLPLGLGLRSAWSMPIRASDGRVLGTFGTYFRECREPTGWERQVVEGLCRAAALAIERRRAEAALRQNDEKLRVALSAAELGTWTYRVADGRWELDEQAQRLYQTGAPVVVHDEALMARIMHPDDIPRMWEGVRRAFDPAGDGRYDCEYRIRQPDGSYRWVRAWAEVQFEGERPIGLIGSSRDITASKETERELLGAKEAAERASVAKSDFLATLSHELRTPLTPVLLTISLMESNPRLPPELREDVATIRRNVELESRLISDLLDLTRIERGKLQLDEQDVDLHLIVRSAIDICQREASAKLTVDLRATKHTVRGDSTRLQQIFWNLINNAIKFTPAEGTITVRSRSAGERRVGVEVSDTGAGIDPALLPKLFSAFEQGDVRVERKQAGLGLGLAISRKLAEAHGGTITVHSEGRGRGATFTVELPLIDVPAHAAFPRQPAPLRREAGRPLNVLLVEDHEPTLRVMERLLRQIGHRVTGVTSVASATAAAGRDGFDLIISDLGLPDGSGFDFIRPLREKYAGRAIALTGYGMDSDIAASREAGFAEHLTKPVDFEALDSAIRRITAS